MTVEKIRLLYEKMFFWVIAILVFSLFIVRFVIDWAKEYQRDKRVRNRFSLSGDARPSIPPQSDKKESSKDDSVWGNVKRFGGGVGKFLLVPWLVYQCRQSNPLLTWVQEAQLERMFQGVVQAWKDGHRVLPLLRATVALAVPNGALALVLVEHIIKTIWPEELEPEQNQGRVYPSDEQMLKIAKTYGIAESRLLKINDPILLRALEQSLLNEPTCAITLDPLLTKSKKIVPDVAMLSNSGHVFLYNRHALEQWINGSSTNPLTRERVDPNRDIIQLS